MTQGNFAVDYEHRSYNPERMRKERLERAQAALKQYGLGAMIVYNYDSPTSTRSLYRRRS